MKKKNLLYHEFEYKFGISSESFEHSNVTHKYSSNVTDLDFFFQFSYEDSVVLKVILRLETNVLSIFNFTL